MSASICWAAGLMSISAAVTPSAVISRQALLVGLVRGAEARQGVGQHVLARQAELVHRPADDDQRLGRIEAARHADDRPLDAARLQPLRQALDLDVVGLVAIVAQLGRVRRHVGKALDGALEGDAVARRVEREVDLAEARDLARPPASRSRRSRCCASAPGGCGRDRRRRARWSSPSRSAAISTSWSPHSKIAAWPSQARSVVDSPGPAAE